MAIAPSTILIPVNTPVLLPNGKMEPSWWAVFVALAEGFVDVVTVTGGATAGDVAIFASPEQITGGLVQTANYADASVTLSKIQDAIGNSKLVGSGSAGAGSPYSELDLGTGLSMSGTMLNVSTASADNAELLAWLAL